MEVVLKPVVSELVKGLVKILKSNEVRHFARQLVKGVDSEIEELENKLTNIGILLRKAEEKQLSDESVKNWLGNLQHWAYDAEDVLDEFAYEALRRKMKAQHQASSSKGFSAVQMGSKIKEINSRLEQHYQQIIKQSELLQRLEVPITSDAALQKLGETSSVAPEQKVYGRKEDEAELLKMVKSGAKDEADANFQVIAVVGMGGIGKTTIAREVYDHKELEDFKFQKKAWVCVSTTTTFDVLRISKELLVEFSSSAPDNLNAVQVRLRDEVRGKKFLIVLDDIWNVKYTEWETLTAPFATGARGSTMIVTTRHTDVAQTIRYSHTYPLKFLSNEACESLFKEHAFGTDAAAAPNQISDSIYKKVVERCGGLPLAAKTLGGLLRSEPSGTWKNILESKIWSTPDERNDILPSLKLSYHYLPANLKSCFGYCAIFPQDYKFEEKELALLWIAEGIVQPSNKQLDEASKCFDKLCSRSLFQQLSRDSSKYVMHDCVHELAQWVFKGISFRFEQNIVELPEKVRYFSYEPNHYTRNNKFEALEKAKSLRTFLSVRPWSNWSKCYISATVIFDLLPKFEMLRALSFEGYQIVYLPASIGDMIHLRYLNFSNTKIRSLPKSTCKLLNLQTLLLKDCSDLTKLPSNMRYLINLCHLDISGRNSLKELPLGMKELKNLQVLSNFIVGKNMGSNLEDLKSLGFLQGELHISGLQNVTGSNQIPRQILSNMNKLKVLILEWRDQVNSQVTDVEMNLLDKLKPPINLRELTIRGYGGESFPSWLGDLSWLSNLRVFTVEKCPQLIVEVPNSFSSLERFVIKDCPKLVVSLSNCPIGCKLEINNCKGMVCNDGSIDFENLDSKYLANISTVEDKLKKGSQRVSHLRIAHNEEIMKSWQSLENTNFLSNMNSLEISECQNLKAIGRGMLPLSLKSLEIYRCEELEFLEDLSVCSLLERLEINWCKSLKCISLDGPLPETLNQLYVEGCDALETLSSSRNEYLPKALTSIKISFCEELKSIGKSFDNSTCLKNITSGDCEDPESLPSGRHHLPCLESIEIRGCPKLSVREGVPTSLRQLLINECEDGKGMGMLASLKELDISYLPQLKSISDLTNLTSLKHLYIRELSELELIPNLSDLTSLEILVIQGLLWLKSIQGLSNLTSPKILEISRCLWIKSIPSLSGLTSLKWLVIAQLPQLESIPDLSNLTSLRRLDIAGLPQLESIQDLSNLTSLERLHMVSCPRIKSIPSLSGLTFFQELKIADLPQLESIQDLSNLTSLEDLQISECPKLRSLQTLPSSLQSLRITNCPLLIKRWKSWGKYSPEIAQIPKVLIDGKFIYNSKVYEVDY